MITLRAVNKNRNATAILNILSSILVEGVLIITTPFYTRLLGPSQYGLYSLFQSWVAIISCVVGLRLESSIPSAMYRFENHYHEYKNCILFLGTICSVIFITFSFVLRNALANYMGLSPALVVTVFLMSMATFITDFSRTCYTYEKKPLANLILSIALSLSSTTLSFVMIYLRGESERYLSRINGSLIAYSVTACIIWFLFFLRRPVFLNFDYWKYALGFSIPIIFHTLSRIVLVQSDRIMMNKLGIPNEQVGIYSVYYSFTSALAILLVSLNNSWSPFFFDDLKLDDWGSINTKTSNYIELFSVLTCGFLLASREVGHHFAGSEYSNGSEIIPLIAMSIYVTFLYHFPVNFEYYYHKTKMIAIGSVMAAGMNIILNRIMIPLWNIYGAAVATLISYVLLFMFHLLFVKKMKDHIFSFKLRPFAIGMVTVIFSSIMFYLMKNLWHIRWIIAIALGGWELLRIKDRRAIF